MCKVCATVLGCATIIALGAVGGSLWKWNYNRVAYYESFIGKRVRIKFNGKEGVIANDPEWPFSKLWTVRGAGDATLFDGREMVLIEEADDE